MDTNYDKGIKAMHEVSNSWKFRYLTIFGKIKVIKIFIMPKLTHTATVVASLTAKQIEEIENIWEDFIRANKLTIADVRSFYTPIKWGGFGIHKVADFWSDIKMSWF